MSFAEGLHAESKRRAYEKKKKKEEEEKKRAQTAAQVVNSGVNDTQKVSSLFPSPPQKKNFEIFKSVEVKSMGR